MNPTTGKYCFEIHHSFDFPEISPALWNGLVQKSRTNEIFLTWEYQQAWWKVFGRGELLIVTCTDQSQVVSIAPFFTEHGMVYITGSGGSDYLDLIGDWTYESFTALLEYVANKLTQFKGFVFYHCPEESNISTILKNTSQIPGLLLTCENEQSAPRMNCNIDPEILIRASGKKSLVRHQKWFEANGSLEILHLTDFPSVAPLLNRFYDQHIERWSSTPFPSLFNNPVQRLFYEEVTRAFSGTNKIIFTVVEFNQRPVAFHFGFYHNRSFLWYKPSFDISFAKHSPGEVLIRQLLELANTKNTLYFDLGLGDESFKARFANDVRKLFDWGIYPS